MRSALVFALLAACYSPSPVPGAPCSASGECPTGLSCRDQICELTGAGDDAPAGDMAGCASLTCVARAALVGCGTSVPCEHGCEVAPTPHCAALSPSNGLTAAMLAGTGTSVVTAGLTFNTTTGRISNGSFNGSDLRMAGEGVNAGIRFQIIDGMGVFATSSFQLAPGGTWTATGTNTLVLLASTITIDGVLDASAVLGTAGPGGTATNSSTSLGLDCRGRAGRLLQLQHGEGGGGGGGATSGGRGGDSDAPLATGAGGSLCTTRSTTIPLRGGAGGGAGGVSLENAGGGGGGAVALVAMTELKIGGTVNVSGGGGVSGPGPSPSGDGGGGGGAGGAILLEAPRVTISGRVTANGGSGASPSLVDGQNGSATTSQPAPGGLFTGPGGTGRGGNGGAGTTAPTNGTTYFYNDGLSTPTSVFVTGGGGGGAAGRIEIKATSVVMNALVISPPATTSLPQYE